MLKTSRLNCRHFLWVAIAFTIAQSHQTVQAATSQARGLDVNDVSVLIPFGPNGLHPSIEFASMGFITESLFESVMRFEYPSNLPNSPSLQDLPYVDSRFVTNLANWRLTSFRIEDCGEVINTKEFATSTAGAPNVLLLSRLSGCQARLRVVAQPLNLFGISLPTAMHVLLNLEPGEFDQLVEDIRAIQDLSLSAYQTTTFGKSLGHHPGLLAELENPGQAKIADMMRSMLEKAVARNRASLALPLSKQMPQIESITLTLQTEINHWKFTGGLVRSGKWLKSETEFNSQFRTSLEFASYGVEDLKCDIHSRCWLSPDPKLIQLPLNPTGLTLASIFQDDLQYAAEQVPGRRSPSTMETSELIDLPSATHFFNTTCVSCHQSGNLRDQKTRVVKDVLPFGITPFVSKTYSSPFTNSVINFGYFGANARISTRTAAESLNVANRINTSKKWRNPGLEITDIEGFWSCIRNESNSQKCYDNFK